MDVETTGRLAGHHEIIQIAVVPLDSEIRPLRGVLPFYMNIAPDHPENAEKQASKIHGLELDKLSKECVTQWKAADVFADWFDSLELPYNKRIIPLAHNWAFESAFLKNWLGLETMDMIWQSQPRDTMICAAMLNDWYGYYEEQLPASDKGPWSKRRVALSLNPCMPVACRQGNNRIIGNLMFREDYDILSEADKQKTQKYVRKLKTLELVDLTKEELYG